MQFYDKTKEDEETVIEERDDIALEEDEDEEKKKEVVETIIKPIEKRPLPLTKLDSASPIFLLECIAKEIYTNSKVALHSTRMQEYEDKVTYYKQQIIFKLSIVNFDVLLNEIQNQINSKEFFIFF
jgi:hypothetical protein